MVNPRGIMIEISGNAIVRAGDGGQAFDASFAGVYGMALDAFGNLLIADYSSATIRMIAYGTTPMCPLGYYCQCALRPIPCSLPTSACLVQGASAPSNVSEGFVAIGIPSPISPSGVAYASIVSCD